jgi:predicted RNA binding protein YcfA (HicA-like mRNA interferase family)
MAKLPDVTANEAIAAFQKLGFVLSRVNGSHQILKKPGHASLVSVPQHGKKSLKRGTLRSLLRDANVTVEEFIELLK